MAKIEAVRGMKDITPAEMPYWHRLETACREVVAQYGYQEIRFPIVEKTQLFKRSVGEVTDIVEKEMYTFDDRNGDSLTLRPEGTAGCVRAGIEQALLHNQIQRLWYMGPMFRHERPQKGRYRQFQQLGVEAYGMRDPRVDVEVIALSYRLWKCLGIADQVVLQINTLGNASSRQTYRDQLIAYLSGFESQLDEDAKRRLHTNPLRILDSKNPDMQAIVAGAPNMQDALDDESKQHFAEVCHYLDVLGIEYDINQRLVRGIDYYCDTVFEWVTDALGAQGTICAGGRYDGLVEQIGGKATPAVGFAMGMERIVLLLQQQEDAQAEIDVYVIVSGIAAHDFAYTIAETCRDHCPSLHIVMDATGGGMKAQFKRSDKSRARYAIIIGEDEAKAEHVLLKDLRGDKPQQQLDITALLAELARA